MKTLLLGSGGREHALAWKLSQSPLLTELIVAPGNAGTRSLARSAPLDLDDHQAIVAYCIEHAIDFVIVGPEGPLVAGLVDDLLAAGIAAFGPSAAAAQLEGSKAFTKAICDEAGIPTAKYAAFDDQAAATHYLHHVGAPIVIKADGLAAGKGVTVAQTLDVALEALAAVFETQGARVVIEECLLGEEASLFALVDGETVLPFGTAQDHKRAYEGDTGPNTGGMGAYSPAPVMTDEVLEEAIDTIVRPTAQAMVARGTPFRGVLYAGLMLTDAGPKLIEYNVRFGDPECQVLMPRLGSDLLAHLVATAQGTLSKEVPLWYNLFGFTVVMAARGYPGTVDKGASIQGLDAAEQQPNVHIFHAGTAINERGETIAAGGRVLNVTSVASTLLEAKMHAYAGVDVISWPGHWLAGFRSVLIPIYGQNSLLNSNAE